MAMAAAVLLAAVSAPAQDFGVRIKELGRLDGVRENMVSGYGIVSGLAGTGDSTRSQATLQSVANALREFGLNVTPAQLASRNVAAVLVTATLPAFARSGDRLDVIVSSMGDARSLTGGALLMTPLYGPDRRIYALAQGAVSVGGYKYELKAVNEKLSASAAAMDAGRVAIRVPEGERERLVDFVARLESLTVQPDLRARVVINERTGTVVSGGGVRLSRVSVAHGDLKVTVVTDFLVSQPGGVLVNPGPGIRTQVVPRTRIEANEEGVNSVTMPAGATVSDLVAALKQVKSTTREVIAILQSIKRAGALHAELVIQ